MNQPGELKQKAIGTREINRQHRRASAPDKRAHVAAQGRSETRQSQLNARPCPLENDECSALPHPLEHGVPGISIHPPAPLL